MYIKIGPTLNQEQAYFNTNNGEIKIPFDISSSDMPNSVSFEKEKDVIIAEIFFFNEPCETQIFGFGEASIEFELSSGKIKKIIFDKDFDFKSILLFWFVKFNKIQKDSRPFCIFKSCLEIYSLLNCVENR